jgi:SAM-dependent methyltransferase
MNLEAVWHDLECADYNEDLPLWHELAARAGGTVLEVGAGTGRVTLDLAAAGFQVIALDYAAPLLEALARRADGLAVETVVADARDFSLDRRVSLVIVPMQTVQLLDGHSGRTGFLRRALAQLQPGGLLAAALADAIDCFDDQHPLPPAPQVTEILGTRYATQLITVADEGGRAAIHRHREVTGPGDHYEAEDVVVRLDRVSANEVAAEGRSVGFLNEPQMFVAETDEYLGSTVVVLRAP